MTAPRILVVNADDFGLTDGVCGGILRAHDRGIVTSTSVLVAAPAFDTNVKALRDSGLGVGIHLCLVGEDPPLLQAIEIPTLVDRHGRLPTSWRRFLLESTAGRVDPADVERELSAQAEKACAAGLRPDHLDAHQNLQLWPPVGSIAISIARRIGAGVLRVADSRRVGPTGTGVRLLGARLRRAAREAKLVVPDHASGLDRAGHMTGAHLGREIMELGRHGRHADLAVHPGMAADPDRVRYRWGFEWAEEMEALCNQSAQEAVLAAGFELGTFGDLLSAVASG